MWYFSFKISYCTYSYSMVDGETETQEKGRLLLLKICFMGCGSSSRAHALLVKALSLIPKRI